MVKLNEDEVAQECTVSKNCVVKTEGDTIKTEGIIVKETPETEHKTGNGDQNNSPNADENGSPNADQNGSPIADQNGNLINTDTEEPQNGTKSDHTQSESILGQIPEPKIGNKKRRKKGIPIDPKFLAIKEYQPYERPSYIQESNGQPRKPRRRVDTENADPTEKLFVGGLPLTLNDDELKEYFSKYGEVVDALVKAERGFGFVTFSSISEADKALENKNHKIDDKEIEVKRAIANKYSNHNGGTRAGRLGDYANGWSVQPAQNGNSSINGGHTASNMSQTYYQPLQLYQQHVVYQPIDTMHSQAAAVIPMIPPTPPSESISPNATPPNSIDNHCQQYDHTYMDDVDRNHHQQKKLFIGGLHWKTHDDDLRDYFSTYGTVTDAMVIIEPNSNRSRGFGFVVFANPEDAERVVSLPNHKINEKVVDVKRAISKDDEADELGKNVPVDKVFVGGLSHETTRESLISFFNTTFGGKVTRVDMKTDDQTGQNRGYAFLTFDNTEVVDQICQNKFHRIGPHLCEVKKAHSKDANLSEQKTDNNNRSGYQSRQQPYYAHYPQYPVDGIYYQPAVSYIPYIPPFAVSTVPVSTPQHQPPSNQSNQPHGNSSNSEIQGEYHFGTWYPSVGKENDNAETDDHSEEVPTYAPSYYNAQAYNPAYNCASYPYTSTYTPHPAYAQQAVKDH